MSHCERKLNKNIHLTSPLLKYSKDFTSQHGEDGILEEIFRRLGFNKNNNSSLEIVTHDDSWKSGFCVEIGSWDGKHLSNTYTLINDYKWGGILIEAIGERSKECEELYNDRNDVKCINALINLENTSSSSISKNKKNEKSQDIVYQSNFLTILKENNCPLSPTLLVIDIDGADYHIWKLLKDSPYKPALVCIEFNPSIPNSVYFIQDSNTEIQQGSSLLAILELGIEMNYSLIVTTTFNAFFLRNDLFENKIDSNIEENTFCPISFPRFQAFLDINLLNVPHMSTDMFQTYDGELHFIGTKKLLWHKKALNHQTLQILPKKMRKYPFAPSEKHSIEYILNISTSISNSFNNIQIILNELSVVKFYKLYNELEEKFLKIMNYINLPHLEEYIIEYLNHFFNNFIELDYNKLFSKIDHGELTQDNQDNQDISELSVNSVILIKLCIILYNNFCLNLDKINNTSNEKIIRIIEFLIFNLLSSLEFSPLKEKIIHYNDFTILYIKFFLFYSKYLRLNGEYLLSKDKLLKLKNLFNLIQIESNDELTELYEDYIKESKKNYYNLVENKNFFLLKN